MKKKMLLGVLLLLCLVLLLPNPAAAAGTSGSCGENLTWTLKDGILTISGSGEMTSVPWSDQKDQIEAIILEAGVSSVAPEAFSNCSELEFVIFKGNAPAFGEKCFQKCTALAYYHSGDDTWISSVMETYGPSLKWLATDFSGSGTCGDNLTWQYANGVLTISGTGDMYQYDKNNMPPWMYLSVEVTKVVIEDGVTSLSHKAFIDFSELSELVIPGSVKTIGGQAFKDCVKLTALVLPEGLEQLGDLAFEKCTGLTSVTLPASLTRIEMDAFSSCSALEKIWFCGDAPEWMVDAFLHVTATAYYPAGNATWTEEATRYCGGTITWKAMCSELVVVIDPAVKPGCTTTGLTEGSHCAECGVLLRAQQEIAATGHSFGDWQQIQAATTEETGIAERKCATCGAAEQMELPKEPVQTDPQPTETEPISSEFDQPTESVPVTAGGTTADADAERTESEQAEGKKESGLVWIIAAVLLAAAAGAGAVVLFKKKH